MGRLLIFGMICRAYWAFPFNCRQCLYAHMQLCNCWQLTRIYFVELCIILHLPYIRFFYHYFLQKFYLNVKFYKFMHLWLQKKIKKNNNNSDIYMAHIIHLCKDAQGACIEYKLYYYYPGFSPSNLVAHSAFEGIDSCRGTHLLHLGREWQLWIKCLV